MSPSKKLTIPSNPAPLPQPQERSTLLAGASSFIVGSLILGGTMMAFALIPLANKLVTFLPPVTVLASPSPSLSATRDLEAAPVLPDRPLPPAPQFPNASAALPSPALSSLPTHPVISSQALSTQAESHLEIISDFAAQEELRLQKIEEAARAAAIAAAAAENERLQKQAEAAKKATLLAERKRLENIEREQRAKVLAAAKAKSDQAEREKARAAAATRQREALAKRIASTPTVTSRKVPTYPRSAQRAGWEGTTRITATVSPQGRISSAFVSQSSGHQILDQTALAAIKRWRFTPARNGLGEAVAHQVILPIPFRLN